MRCLFQVLALFLMGITASHALSATTPDDPAYEIQVKHWNSSHAVTLNAVGSEISGAFSNANGLSFGLSAGAITGSYTVPVVLPALVFSNSNGVSFGTNVLTVTATVKTDYQSSGAYLTTAMQSNAATLSNIKVSAGTLSANRSDISFVDSQGVSFGLATDGKITATVKTDYQTAGAYLTTAMLSNAATISNIKVSAGAASANRSDITFTDSNGISFGLATDGKITGTVKTDYQSSGAYLTTAMASNRGTDFVQATAAFAGTNASGTINSTGISVSVAAAGGGGTLSYWEPAVRGTSTSTASLSNGTVYFQPFVPDANISAYRLQLLQQLTTQAQTTMSFSGSVSANPGGSSGTGQWGQSGTLLVFSRVSTGTAANSSQLISYYSNTYSYQIRQLVSISRSTNGSSATVSWTTSGDISFVSSFGSNGQTTGSFGSTGSSTFTSTSTNANTFSSSYAMTFASQVMSQIRPIIVPFRTSMSAGEYWLAHIQSSSSASTNFSLQNIVTLAPGIVFYVSNTTGYAEIGSSATIASSNVIPGWGSYSASSQTTTTIPLSQISNQSQFQTWFNLLAQVK